VTSETICFVRAIDAIRTARQTFTRLDIWKICERTLFNTTGLVQIGLFIEEVADITGYAFRHVIIVDGDTIHARRDTRETHSRRDVAVRRIGTEAHTFTTEQELGMSAGKTVSRTGTNATFVCAFHVTNQSRCHGLSCSYSTYFGRSHNRMRRDGLLR
jgi:hypothetical protein